MKQLPDAVEHRVFVGGVDVRVVTAGTGSNAVLFDAALGTPLEEWSLVAPAVARDAKVVLWDRPGIGGSGNGPPLSAQEMAAAMRQLLSHLRVDSVVAVGHSRGGLNILCLALLHPEIIRGVVLVEPSHPDQDERMPRATPGGDPLMRVASVLSSSPPWVPKGAGAAASVLGALLGRRLSPGARLMAEMAPLMAQRAGAITAENEARITLLAEAQTLLRSRTFPPVPLEVLTGTKNYKGSPDDAAEWQALHAELASLSPRGQQTFVECGHDMPLSRPDAVIDAVMRFQRD